MSLTEAQNRQIAVRIREAMARRRISRQALADEARISVSTLEKALGGDRPFSLASLVRIEQALGIALRSAEAAAPQVAPEELGGYARGAVAWLEGEYLTLRPSFESARVIHAYCTVITWDEKRLCLQFREGERFDSVNAQAGLVSLPSLTGKVYLSTVESGQMRLAILNSPTRLGALSGLLLTLTAGPPSVPVSAPIVLLPRKAEHRFGRFGAGDSEYPRYQTILQAARKTVQVHDHPA